jgi:hypothetical protein
VSPAAGDSNDIVKYSQAAAVTPPAKTVTG